MYADVDEIIEEESESEQDEFNADDIIDSEAEEYHTAQSDSLEIVSDRQLSEESEKQIAELNQENKTLTDALNDRIKAFEHELTENINLKGRNEQLSLQNA